MTDVVQPVAAAPAAGDAPGWRAMSADGLEISYWDGTRYTAHRVWDGLEWCERDAPAAGPVVAPILAGAQVAASGIAFEGTDSAQATVFTPPDRGIWQPPPRPKKRTGLAIVVIVGLFLAAAAAGAGVVVLKRSTDGLSGKTAAQVLALSVNAATAQDSVHLAADEMNGSSAVGSYDITPTGGTQTVSAGAQGNASLLAMPGVAYLKADAAFLRNSLGLTASAASKYAGQWISFTASDPGYTQLVSGDTLSSALKDASPTGALSLTPTRTLNGREVIGVVGGLPAEATQSGATGTVTLYVSTTAPYLPVEVVTDGSLNGQSGSSTVTFSHWREPVSVAAPAGATPFSSLARALAPSPKPG